jgi:hypothetical protein
MCVVEEFSEAVSFIYNRYFKKEKYVTGDHKVEQ